MKFKVNILNIFLLVCLIVIVLPVDAVVLKTISLVILLIGLNFTTLSIASVGFLIYGLLLVDFGDIFLDASAFTGYFMIKKLNLFLVLLLAFVVNIIIVSIKLYRLNLPIKEKFILRINYYFNLLIYKIRFLYPILAFVFLIFTVIYSFAGIYSAYEDKYYGYYAVNVLEDKPENIQIEEFQDSQAIRAYYLSKYDNKGELLLKEEVRVCGDINVYGPLGDKIFIDTYDAKGKSIDHTLIERGFSNTSDNYNLVNSIDTLYFSCVTIFTVGYGDITPIAPQIKQIAQIEMLTGYLITCLFVPFLIVAVQKLIEGEIKKSKLS
ncbi:potassium channel family protein [Desulfitobacterium sp.]|uniref:potassium channel family protein n=1 Tax=Desulfitobacterium sp. TaxID=49981 RepID=UPI002B2027C0|nr:potassium channel family protein [Desulfitobacterium sp.]MEA4901907.1 potassium channel family protein [Desulfitobacterium sp.]